MIVAYGLMTLSLGVGIWLSALTVAYCDFRHAVSFLMQLWMFATPCIYRDVSLWQGTRWEWVLPLNPAFGFVSAFRSMVLSLPVDRFSLAMSTAVSLVLLLT